MGAEILNGILKAITAQFIKEISMVTIISNLLDYGGVFNCEQTVKQMFGIDVSSIVVAVFKIAYWMLILKFVWKGFDIYLLGLDGDEDSDPMSLFFNFVKALIISLGFGLLFGYFTNIAFNICDTIMKALHTKVEFSNALDTLSVIATSLVMVIMCVVYLVLVVVLTVMFMQKTLELVILRIGISFAVSGLLDSDGGVFKPYVKKFFQISLTIILQTVCFKLSVMALANTNMIGCISALVMALKAPQFLSEFIMVNQGGGGKLQQAVYSYSILRSFSKK